eukprot:ANDGO_04324.mRNA.1 hypothetical protein
MSGARRRKVTSRSRSSSVNERWRVTDDIEIVRLATQGYPLHAIPKLAQLSYPFTVQDVTARWDSLLHDEPLADAVTKQISVFLDTQNKRVPWTATEDQILTDEYLKKGIVNFDFMLDKFRQVFHPSRTAKSVEAHFYKLRRAGKLPDLAPLPTLKHEGSRSKEPLKKRRRGAKGEALRVSGNDKDTDVQVEAGEEAEELPNLRLHDDDEEEDDAEEALEEEAEAEAEVEEMDVEEDEGEEGELDEEEEEEIEDGDGGNVEKSFTADDFDAHAESVEAHVTAATPNVKVRDTDIDADADADADVDADVDANEDANEDDLEEEQGVDDLEDESGLNASNASSKIFSTRKHSKHHDDDDDVEDDNDNDDDDDDDGADDDGAGSGGDNDDDDDGDDDDDDDDDDVDDDEEVENHEDGHADEKVGDGAGDARRDNGDGYESGPEQPVGKAREEVTGIDDDDDDDDEEGDALPNDFSDMEEEEIENLSDDEPRVSHRQGLSKKQKAELAKMEDVHATENYAHLRIQGSLRDVSTQQVYKLVSPKTLFMYDGSFRPSRFQDEHTKVADCIALLTVDQSIWRLGHVSHRELPTAGSRTRVAVNGAEVPPDHTRLLMNSSKIEIGTKVWTFYTQ